MPDAALPPAPAFTGLAALADRAMLRSKRSRWVAEMLLKDIVARGWPEGVSLGVEPDLIAQLGVSRATFREAVRDLERHGVIISRRGRGLVVAAPAREGIIAALTGFIRLKGVDRRDVLDVAALLRAAPGGANPVIVLLLDALAPFEMPADDGTEPAILFPTTNDADKLAVVTARRIASDIEERSHGDRLGTEADYLATYPVSRATLREALALLEGHGLVVRRQGLGGGLFKGRPSPRLVAETAAIYLHYLRLDGEAVLAARSALEPEAAARAAREAPHALRADFAAMLERRTPGRYEVHDLHRAFHLLLAELSGNAVLSLFVQLLLQSYYLVETSDQPAFLEGLEASQRAIAAAVANGDPEGARAAMMAHLDFTRRWTRAGLLHI